MNRTMALNLQRVFVMLMSGFISMRCFVLDCLSAQSKISCGEYTEPEQEESNELEQLAMLQWQSLWSTVSDSVVISLKSSAVDKKRSHFNHLNQNVSAMLNAHWRHQLVYVFTSSLSQQIRACRHLSSGEADHCDTSTFWNRSFFRTTENTTRILPVVFFFIQLN